MTKRASCGLMYGAMNSTKTTNLGRIARYLYEKYGLTSRLITADNEYDTLQDLIDSGVIEVFSIVNIPNPFPVLTKLSQGMWPTPVRRGAATVIEMFPTPPERMAKIGAYLLEGTTTIGELLLADHIHKARTIGEDVVGKFSEDGITFAKSGRSHYGHVQDFVTMDLIPQFSTLPLRWVWWTGHEYAGEDEATGQKRFGPGVVGKAATMTVPRKVGNTFHMNLDEKTKLVAGKNVRTLEYRAYFEPHASPMLGIMWPAGVKMPVTWVPAWRERFPEGFISLELDSGIEQYIQFLDDMAAKEGKTIVSVAGAQPEPSMLSGGGPAATEKAPAPAPVPQPATQTRPAATPIRRPMVPPRPPFTRPTSTIAAVRTTPPDKLEETLVASIEQATGAAPDINALPGNGTSEPVQQIPNQKEDPKPTENEVK